MREKLFKAFGMIFGALASWPSVSKYLGTTPDFSQSEMFGMGVGFILGLFLFSTRVVQSVTASWSSLWKVLLLLVLVVLWLLLNRYFQQQYDANWGKGLTHERFENAKFSVTALALLWSTPLTYIGGALAESLTGKKGP